MEGDWYQQKLSIIYQIFRRLNNLLLNSHFPLFYQVELYEQVWDPMHREVKSPVMILFLSWTLTRIYFNLAVPYCSLNLSDEKKFEGLKIHQKAFRHFEIVNQYISDYPFEEKQLSLITLSLPFYTEQLKEQGCILDCYMKLIEGEQQLAIALENEDEDEREEAENLALDIFSCVQNRINKDKTNTYAHILAKVYHNFGRIYFHLCKDLQTAKSYLLHAQKLVDQLKLSGSDFTREVWHLKTLEDKQAVVLQLEKIEEEKNQAMKEGRT